MGHAQSPANVRRSEVIPLTSSLRIRWKAPVNGACIDRYLVVVRPRVPVAGSDAREQETYQVGSSSNDFRWACAAHARTQLTAAAHTMRMCVSNHCEYADQKLRPLPNAGCFTTCALALSIMWMLCQSASTWCAWTNKHMHKSHAVTVFLLSSSPCMLHAYNMHATVLRPVASRHAAAAAHVRTHQTHLPTRLPAHTPAASMDRAHTQRCWCALTDAQAVTSVYALLRPLYVPRQSTLLWAG